MDAKPNIAVTSFLFKKISPKYGGKKTSTWQEMAKKGGQREREREEGQTMTHTLTGQRREDRGPLGTDKEARSLRERERERR